MTFLGKTEERGKAVDTMALFFAKTVFTNQSNRLTI